MLTLIMIKYTYGYAVKIYKNKPILFHKGGGCVGDGSAFDYNVKGVRPSALFFNKWNKNCFLFISIISNRIQFIWKIIRGMKRGSFFTKLNIMSYHDMKKTSHSRNNLHNFFNHTLKLKICDMLWNNLMVIHIQIQAENTVKLKNLLRPSSYCSLMI